MSESLRPDKKPALHVQEGVPEPPSINPCLRTPRARSWPVEELVERLRDGDRVALARAITLVESTRPEHHAQALEIIERCMPYTGRSLRVGISGAPGAGKSTLIEALGTRLTRAGHRLAVLAIDPSSTRTRGSILGDKTRMPRLSADPNAFIRPSPSSGSLGGVARTTRETILLCEAAGHDLLFIETVGVGQSETTAHSMVDFFLVLALAGAGDELQGIKRGILELADAVVITKADGANREAALHARRLYQRALRLFPPPPSGWRPPVLTCSALTGEGLDELWETIDRYRTEMTASGYFEENRRRQAGDWMRQTIEHRLLDHFYHHPDVRTHLPAFEAAVLAGETSPFAAAERLLALYTGRTTSEP